MNALCLLSVRPHQQHSASLLTFKRTIIRHTFILHEIILFQYCSNQASSIYIVLTRATDIKSSTAQTRFRKMSFVSCKFNQNFGNYEAFFAASFSKMYASERPNMNFNPQNNFVDDSKITFSPLTLVSA